MKLVFFYGLFMDGDILREKGLNPKSPRVASVQDYGLRIGERATLIPSSGEIAHGQIMELDQTELDALYSEKSVADYVPETIEVTTTDGNKFQASCYNLPITKLTGTNKEYAQSLSVLAKKVGLPDDYIRHIQACGN